MQFYQQRTHALIFFSILLFSSNIFANIHACNQSERSSLLSFALTLSPPTPLNWTSTNCCIWEGITCNRDGRVTHLQLPSRNLKLKEGSIPSPSLRNLTHLTHLNLSHNSLHGSLQKTEFFLSLNRLEIIDLSYNLLTGKLPFSPPFSNIRILDLSSNHFNGSVPASFFQHFRNLTSFNISNNSFTGSIPSSNICLHCHRFLEILDFSVNQFNGSLSHGLGKCSKLQVFCAGYNNLSGLLPQDIYNATKLVEISLPHNSLYGAIGEKIVNFTNLRILDFNSNGFSGMLPRSIGKLSKLKFLLLDLNHLKRSLPPSLMNCTNLVELRIAFNSLEGNISALDFSKLIQLTKVDLMANNLTGVIPVSLYSCKSLKAIRMSFNNLEGEILPKILSLKSLYFLGFTGLTNITGTMKILMCCKTLAFLSFPSSFVGEELPADLGMVDFDGFQNLRHLSFSNCGLTGQLPIWLSRLRKLEVLNLGHNRITGSIPSWLGTLPKLFHLDLRYNLISGEFPKELCGLPSLVCEPIATQTKYESDFELPIYSITDFASFHQFGAYYIPRVISIGNNTMNGSIPLEIGQLQLLQKLYVYNNNFSGNIPDQISNLKQLEIMNVSMNHFSGKIPTSLASLSFLKVLDVSYNNLEGSIPTGTQLQSFSASAFEGNPKLCGAPLARKCAPLEPNDRDIKNNQDYVENRHPNQIPGFYISTALGFVVGFWGVCCPLVLKKEWRYAYFKILESTRERLLMKIEVCVARMKRRFRS